MCGRIICGLPKSIVDLPRSERTSFIHSYSYAYIYVCLYKDNKTLQVIPLAAALAHHPSNIIDTLWWWYSIMYYCCGELVPLYSAEEELCDQFWRHVVSIVRILIMFRIRNNCDLFIVGTEVLREYCWISKFRMKWFIKGNTYFKKIDMTLLFKLDIHNEIRMNILWCMVIWLF